LEDLSLQGGEGKENREISLGVSKGGNPGVEIQWDRKKIIILRPAWNKRVDGQ